MFTKYNTRQIVLVCLAAIVIGSILFPVFDKNKILMGLARFVSGFFQVFLVIYFPVWVDAFGDEKKTIWLTYLQLAVVLGLVIGYIFTAMFNMANSYFPWISWRYSFYMQALLLSVCFVVFLKTDQRDLATNEIITDEDDKSVVPNFENMPVLRTSFFARTPSIMMNKQYDMDAMEEISDIGDATAEEEAENDEKLENLVHTKEEVHMGGHGGAISVDDVNIKESLKLILKKRLFLVTMLALSSLYFIITAIQYWISDYMMLVLGLPKAKVFIFFVVISVTAPTAGLILGGKVSEMIGGYTGKHAILFCLVNSILASIFGFPIPFISSPNVCGVLIWIELFFGAAMLPTLTGLMISSIPQKTRNLGNSIAQFTFNLLGYIPAPVTYSYLNHLDPSKH